MARSIRGWVLEFQQRIDDFFLQILDAQTRSQESRLRPFHRDLGQAKQLGSERMEAVRFRSFRLLPAPVAAQKQRGKGVSEYQMSPSKARDFAHRLHVARKTGPMDLLFTYTKSEVLADLYITPILDRSPPLIGCKQVIAATQHSRDVPFDSGSGVGLSPWDATGKPCGDAAKNSWPFALAFGLKFERWRREQEIMPHACGRQRRSMVYPSGQNRLVDVDLTKKGHA
ncbi:hypothetical protein FB45DRAFT_874547 [Roridomyces roridus]|uniref:Uncharacterized protein n=1 Tax=Roridomyces roridus TaxID=1738132 RepID=A0AAD7B806_9AGAR|nr:hypothetical protein FB45DRAFT_874547 [Roridomyces roridus]